jgi:hypothetical protein
MLRTATTQPARRCRADDPLGLSKPETPIAALMFSRDSGSLPAGFFNRSARREPQVGLEVTISYRARNFVRLLFPRILVDSTHDQWPRQTRSPSARVNRRQYSYLIGPRLASEIRLVVHPSP